MSKPLDVTTLNASCEPSDDQAGFSPLMGWERSVLSSPVSGSTARSSGEPLRVVANPIRDPSGDACRHPACTEHALAPETAGGLDARKNREYVRVGAGAGSGLLRSVSTGDNGREPV
jgi:hypothetical protein